MAANKTSAISDEPVDVLFCLHPKFNLMDFAGPMEVFTTAAHDFKDEGTFRGFSTSIGSLPRTETDTQRPQQTQRHLK